jgi:hypothetical protein
MTDPKTGTALRMGDPQKLQKPASQPIDERLQKLVIEPCMQVDDPTRNG